MTHHGRTRQPVAGATGGDVPARVEALMCPRPHTRPIHAAIVIVMAASVIRSTLTVQDSAEALFEQALQPSVSALVHRGRDA